MQHPLSAALRGRANDTMTVERRQFVKQLVVGALGTGLAWRALSAQTAVPNSAASGAPTLRAPAGACDCHHHIYDAVRFPQPAGLSNPLIPNARIEEYGLLRQRLGLSRGVVVTPSAYGVDNAVTLHAIERLGGTARGVAVVQPSVTDAQLRVLEQGGIRGVRFSLATSVSTPSPVTTLDMIEPLARRIASLGWHVQINWDADNIAAAEALWSRLPCPVVFDHIGHIPGPAGVRHPAYAVMRRLVDKGAAWVKLSVSNDNTADGPPTYADIVRLGQAFVAAAPERLVWGSNWPHPTEPAKPDDAALFDLMGRWAPDEAVRRRILVDNPATLYQFGSQA